MMKRTVIGTIAGLVVSVGLAGCAIPKSETMPEKPSAAPVAQGVPVHLGALTITVTNVWQRPWAMHGMQPEPGGAWLVVSSHVENTGYDSASFDPMFQTYILDGRRYQADLMASGGGASLSPGFSRDLELAFDVPASEFSHAHNLSVLEVHDGFTAPAAYITISGVTESTPTTTTTTPCIGMPSQCAGTSE